MFSTVLLIALRYTIYTSCYRHFGICMRMRVCCCCYFKVSLLDYLKTYFFGKYLQHFVAAQKNPTF